MRLIQTIESKLNQHLAAGNCEPKHIYLGHTEHKQLREECIAATGWDPGDIKDSNYEESGRLEWCGLKVFEVDATSHIDFG